MNGGLTNNIRYHPSTSDSNDGRRVVVVVVVACVGTLLLEDPSSVLEDLSNECRLILLGETEGTVTVERIESLASAFINSNNYESVIPMTTYLSPL